MAIKQLSPSSARDFVKCMSGFNEAVHALMHETFPDSIDRGLTAILESFVQMSFHHAMLAHDKTLYIECLKSALHLLKFELDRAEQGEGAALKNIPSEALSCDIDPSKATN